MPGYFQNFPLIRYSNTYSRNLLTRVVFQEDVLKQRYNYYPYEMKTNMRPDLLAHFYYDNSYYDWTIFASNSIIDPYYQWYLSDENLTKLIESKYGSIAKAISKIHHWEVNWVGDDRTLTINEFNSLTTNPTTKVDQKKYWAPIIGDQQSVIGYKRKQLELIVTTNKIVEFNTTFSSGNNFTVDEKVYQTSGSIVSASGLVQFSNSSILLLNNITGTFSNTYSLVGEDSSSVASYTTSNVISYSIPESEAQYWSPVTLYDHEISLNEKRRTVNVINKNFIGEIQSSFENIVNNE